MQRIRKGDEVVVLSGRDKGKRGTVLRRVDTQHVVVEGVNRVKKHQRPNPMKGVTGGIVELDKGKRGTVLRRIDPQHVVVEGVNRVKKHQRPNPMKGITGGIVELDKPIHISNIALFNPATKKADRAGIKALEDGRKVRVFKANGEQVDA